MKTTHTRILCGALVAFLLFFVGTTIAAAQTTGDYSISWWTVDGGGGTSQSAEKQYTLSGAIGQAEVGDATGIGYAIKGGFWASLSAAIREILIYLPLVSH